MTHLLLMVLAELGCAGIGVIGATAVADVVDVVGVELELVLSDVVLLLDCLPKTVCPLKVAKPLLL